MEVAEEEYPPTRSSSRPTPLWETQDEVDIPEDAVMVEERLADAMLQWMQLRRRVRHPRDAEPQR